jgi:hypothetical protein
VLAGPVFSDWTKVQTRFDQWRQVYNHQRPHQALGIAVPASRYQVSPRSFPEVLPAIEYAPGDVVRKAQDQRKISFHNRDFRVGKAFRGYLVALRPTLQDGVFTVHFCSHQIAEIRLRDWWEVGATRNLEGNLHLRYAPVVVAQAVFNFKVLDSSHQMDNIP